MRNAIYLLLGVLLGGALGLVVLALLLAPRVPVRALEGLVGRLGLALLLLLFCLFVLFHLLLELARAALLGTLIGVELGAVDVVLKSFDASSVPETGTQRRDAWALILAKY